MTQLGKLGGEPGLYVGRDYTPLRNVLCTRTKQTSYFSLRVAKYVGIHLGTICLYFLVLKYSLRVSVAYERIGIGCANHNLWPKGEMATIRIV